MTNINHSAHTNNKLTGPPVIDESKQVIRNISNMPEVTQVRVGAPQPSANSPFGLSFRSYRDDGFTIVAANDRFAQQIEVITPYAEAVVDLLKKQHLLPEPNDRTEHGLRRKGNHKQNAKRERDEARNQTGQAREPDDGRTTLADLLNPTLLEKIREQLPQEPSRANDKAVPPSLHASKSKADKRLDRKKALFDNEPSFQELMGGVDDEASFAELFANSNQDWKKFK